MTQQAVKQGQPGQGVPTLPRLVELLRPYRLKLSLAVLMLSGLTAVNILIPQLIAIVFDEVFESGNWMLLFTVLGSMLGLFVLRNLLYFGGKTITVTVGEDLCFGLRKRLFERLQHMNMRYYQHNKPGQLSSRVMNDSFVIQQFIQDEFPKLVQAVLLFLGIVATTYAMNWQLALASTVVLPLNIAVYYYLRRPIKQASRAAQGHLADATGNLIEKFLGIEVVKGFVGEARENEAFEHAIDLSRRSQKRGQRYHVLQKVLADLLVGLGIVLLFGFGAYQVFGVPKHRALETGEFIAFFWYIRMLYPTVIEMMSGSAKLARTSASIERVYEVLDLTPDEQDDEVKHPVAINGRLGFQDVGVSFGDGAEVLQDVSFEIEPGQVCAIVGPSGAGKSTLMSLVPRLNEPTSGKLLLDGDDIKQFPLRQLRGVVGIAFQEAFLFSSTILENLRYANPEASREEVVGVLKRIGLHEFVIDLPNGYDTMIGDAGLSLSRGQKQMITLARAILKDPKVLILDEATASIDVAQEAAIIPVILDFMKGKTTLMVTHRPELLKHVDKVIHLEAGRVIYDGPPEGFDTEAFTSSKSLDLPKDERIKDAGPGHRGLSPRGGLNLLAAAVLCGMSVLGGVRGVQAAEGAEPKAEVPAPAEVVPAVEETKQAEPPAPEKPAATKPAAPPKAAKKPPTGQLIAQPGMTHNELGELVEVVVSRISAELGYQKASDEAFGQLGQVPEGLSELYTLSREDAGGLRLIQIGCQSFVSQPGQVWLVGRRIGKDGSTENSDLKQVVPMIQAAGTAQTEEAKAVGPADLKSARIELSYIEADRCLAVLKSLGIQTIEYKKAGEGVGRAQVIEPTSKVDPANLPAVMLVPGPEGVGLVGGTTKVDAKTLSVATDMPNMTSASPLMHLLVFYHPHRPEQYARVHDLIRRTIDIASGQIVIEAMVLEISETGLKQLGVEWELETPFTSSSTLDGLEDVSLGRFPSFTGGPTLDISIGDINNHWRAQIKALVTNRQAEILSRPSVLTLDNRQASIRVGEDIPIATSVQGTGGGDKISFSFSYIPVGILLNVRPRISSDGEDVSMQIDAIVSAQVPGEDLVIVDNNGDELARAPRIASRRVQTQTRIANNTPFIIGGLVSKDSVELEEKVPLLGDLPIVGNLFKSTTNNRLKREVIIVITPYVLPKDQIVGRNTPEDKDAFDSFDNELFRDAYRIRAEDVFDLRFLFENLQVQKMVDMAGQVLRRRPDMAPNYPLSQFSDGQIPGERILVYRQMYEVIKRRGIDNDANPSRMIFFKDAPDLPAGFEVEFIEEYLADMLGVKPPGLFGDEDWLFDEIGDQAVAITFTERAFDDAIDAPTQPVPEVKLVNCPDRDTWGTLLWELNQPDNQGRRRFSILLRDGRDISRLQRAVVVKQTVQLNATQQSLRLRNFTQGRLLLVPTIKDDQVFLIDEDVAQYFFYTEHYYPALQSELQRDMEALQNLLHDTDYRRLLDEPEQVDRPVPWRPTGR
jgi:ABC-type multidrug transport system fused ATPase/permease subunit